ncbi:hypothetical protein TNCV_3395191 [Trichonephila clavipes]|nr:hypothetical protein TNCV_3395191 [Trichonephila clavipes]
MRAKAYCAQFSICDLGPEVHEQMLRSGGQSDAKPSELSSQARLVLIYRSLKGRKAESTFPSPWFEPRIYGVEAQ